MANKRIYRVQRLTIGSTAIGGLQTFNLIPGYANVVESTPDGAIGVEDVDLSGLQVSVNLTSTDISKAVTAITETGGAATLACLESGAGTAHTKTLAGIVWNSLGLDGTRNADATMALGGELKAGEGAADGTILDALLTIAGTVTKDAAFDTAFPQTYPARYFRPNNMSFLKTGGTDPDDRISPVHLESYSLSVSGRLIRDNSDTDAGFSAIDLVDWGLWDVSVTFRDATVAAGRIIASDLILESQGKLTIDLQARAQGAANAVTLALDGVKFVNYTENDGPDYSTFTASGKASWKLAATPFNPLAWVADGGASPPVLAILDIS